MEVLFISINRFVRYWNTDTCCIDDYSNQVGSLKNPEITLRARENLVVLETAMDEVSGYREIRDLLIQGWDAMGVNKLQRAISDLIVIRHMESSSKEERSLTALQIILTLIFGSIAIPTFSEAVVKPVWNLLNFWKPANLDAAQLWFVLITIIVIGIRKFIFDKYKIKKTLLVEVEL